MYDADRFVITVLISALCNSRNGRKIVFIKINGEIRLAQHMIRMTQKVFCITRCIKVNGRACERFLALADF
jgi:hypothetical protein